MRFASLIVMMLIQFTGTAVEVSQFKADETDFLEAFAELPAAFDRGTPMSVLDLSNRYFSQPTLNHIKSGLNRIPDPYKSVALMIEVICHPETTKDWELFPVSNGLRNWIDEDFDSDWLTPEEMSRIVDKMRQITSIKEEWGSVPSSMISESHTLLETWDFYLGCKNFIRLPINGGTFEDRLFTAIESIHAHLEIYQNQLEGLSTSDISLNPFLDLLKHISPSDNEFPDLAMIASPDATSKPVLKTFNQTVVECAEKTLIPSELIDWVQMLDQVEQDNWNQALDCLWRLKPGFEFSLFNSSQQSETYLQVQTTLRIFRWIVSIGAIAFSVFFLGGVNRARILTIISIVVCLAIRIIEPLASLHSIPENPPHGFLADLWFAWILAAFLFSQFLPHRRNAGIALLTTGVLGAILPTPVLSSVMEWKIYVSVSIVRTSIYLAWGIVAYLVAKSIRKGLKRTNQRDLDTFAYPGAFIILALVCFSWWLRTTFVPIESGSSNSTMTTNLFLVIVTTQLIRYVLLRWTNSLNVRKTLLIWISILLVLTAVGLVESHIDQGNYPTTQSSSVHFSGYSVLFLSILSIMLIIASIPNRIRIHWPQFMRRTAKTSKSK